MRGIASSPRVKEQVREPNGKRVAAAPAKQAKLYHIHRADVKSRTGDFRACHRTRGASPRGTVTMAMRDDAARRVSTAEGVAKRWLQWCASGTVLHRHRR